MGVAEFFDQMGSEYRSAVPWPWPRMMSEDELAIYHRIMPRCVITGVRIDRGDWLTVSRDGVTESFVVKWE